MHEKYLIFGAQKFRRVKKTFQNKSVRDKFIPKATFYQFMYIFTVYNFQIKNKYTKVIKFLIGKKVYTG